MFKKFRQSDLFLNVVEAHPKVEFFLNSGSVNSIHYNRIDSVAGSNIPDGHVGLSNIINSEPFTALTGLLLPPEFGSTLEMWYTADAPASNGRPFDRGLQELGEVSVIDTEPLLSSSGGPMAGFDAWAFNLTGRFRDDDAPVSISSEPHTIAAVCRVTGSGVVQDMFSFGNTATPFVRAINSVGSIRYRPDGSATFEVNTGDPVDTQWHVVVYQRNGALDQIYSAVLGNITGLSSSAGAIASTDLFSRVDMGGVGANEFDGKIAHLLAWSGLIDPIDVWTWARDFYGL